MRKQIFNPFLPLSEYIPDVEPHAFGNRLFVFGSHDRENGESFCMEDYVGWSALIDDLTTWECSGVIYSAKQDPLYDETKRPHMYAPDVVQGNDGRYYLYYCLSGFAGVGGYSNPISIAVCDTPNGKYEYYGVVQNPDGTPLMKYVCFDPAVINDNGVIRLYYGAWYPFDEKRNILSNHLINRIEGKMYGRTVREIKNAVRNNGGIHGAIHVTLSDDMKTISSEPCRILSNHVKGTDFAEHPFFEASSIRKIGDMYYFVYSSILSHELCYATSKFPDKGFQFRGTIISNGDIGYKGRKAEERLNHTGNNHGGMECVNGQWYIFYHRPTHHSEYSRQVCAEKITIAENGTIEMVEMTSCGLNMNPLEGNGTYPAAICCNLTNGKMGHGTNLKKENPTPCITNDKEERYIQNISNRTLIGYKYFRFHNNVTIRVKVRGNGKGILEVKTDLQGTSKGEIEITASQNWYEAECTANISEGIYPLYFYYKGEGKVDFLEFTLEEEERV